jgi:transcription initiation factor IIF auxiliary subunit
MTLRLEQSSEYHGNDWWKWSVWLEGTDAELDDIDYVEYTLHATFANPVRKIDDRVSKFRLETSGWGTFTLYAKARHKDSNQTELQHELQLFYDDGTPTSA